MSSSAWAIFCSQESVSATTWEMWHLSARVGVDGAGGVEIHVAGGADGVVGAQDRLAGSAVAVGRRRRWPGRCGRRRRGRTRSAAAAAGRCCPCSVTHSASQRLAMPSSCGKSQGLVVAPSSSRKYFSSVSLASRKATSLGRRRFRSSRVWMLDLADDGRVLGLGRDVGGGERQLRVVGEGGGRAARRQRRSGSRAAAGR